MNDGRKALRIELDIQPDDLKDWKPDQVYEFFAGLGRLLMRGSVKTFTNKPSADSDR